MVLATGQDDALGVARGAAGIENVCNIVVAGLGIERLYLALARTALAQLQEFIEIDAARIVGNLAYRTVVDDDLLERRTERQHPVGLLVLLLLAYEKEPDLGIANHVLNLLLGTGGIERHRDCTNAKGAEVGEEILHRVLREDAHVLLHLNAQVEHGITDLANLLRELIP